MVGVAATEDQGGTTEEENGGEWKCRLPLALLTFWMHIGYSGRMGKIYSIAHWRTPPYHLLTLVHINTSAVNQYVHCTFNSIFLHLQKVTSFLGAQQMFAFLALHWHVLSVPSTLDGLSHHFSGRPIQSELLSSAERWRAASLVTPSSSPSCSRSSFSSSPSQPPLHL